MSTEEFHDFDDDCDDDFLGGCDDDDDGEPLDLCSMNIDGQCGQAGSEYCDFECPYRDG